MRSYGRPSVLIVDDEETVRAVCKRALTKAGYEPVAVATGHEALAAVQRDSFDVFMLDVRMPDLDGPRLLSLLREHDPDTPCLVISGYADFDAAVACLRHGASDFVRKPFDIGTMVMAVDRVLASTHLKVDSALLAATQTIFSSLDSREISNPACAVLAYLELAREQLRGGFAVEAGEAVDRAAAGANAILDVCRSLRLLGSSPRPTVTDLKQVLESAIMLASYELRGRARIVLDLPPRPVLLLCEQAKLGQVFLNLLLNAAQAIAPGAAHENQVTVRASAHGGEVTVRVEDTGRGVSAAVLPHLFEPSVTTKKSATGHGMGLAICRWIVEEMGGHIRCIPDFKRGAAFEVRIPVEPRAAPRATSR